MVSVINAEYGEHYHGKDWHRTRDAAIARAKKMKEAKLESIHEKMSQIAGLNFERDTP